MGKVVKSLSLPKESKRARAGSWILLAIEERGKIISIGRLKGLIIALVLTVVVIVVSVSSLLIIAKSASKENAGCGMLWMYQKSRLRLCVMRRTFSWFVLFWLNPAS
jgi:hypothetical protein